MVTQTVMMILAFLLAGLAWFKIITVWEIAAIAFLNGTAMAMNAPSYQALVPRLVKREDLTNAIALNSAQFNMSRILGPTLGGYAMVLFGVAGNFFLNGASFLAVLWALTRIRYPDEKKARQESMWASLRGGFVVSAAATTDVRPGVDDDGCELAGISIFDVHSVFREGAVECGGEWPGVAAGRIGAGRGAGRDDGSVRGDASASWCGVDWRWSGVFSGDHRIQLFSRLRAFGVPGIFRGLLRDHDDLVLQRIDSALVVG